MTNKTDKTLTALKKHNYWSGDFGDLGYQRSNYLNFLTDSLGSNLIKVLTGQRRSGKSYILKQIASYLVKKHNVDPIDILYVNFELLDFHFVKKAKQLQDLVELYLSEIKTNPSNKSYIFLDEVQDIKGWELAVNSLLADGRFSKEIFITGSNSNLISSELATYLTGRYISKDVYPLSFSEYTGFLSLKPNRENLVNFLALSQMPETLSLKSEEAIRNYISSLKDSILLKDIVQRYKVHNAELIEKLFLFLVDNIGNPFSLNSMVKKLKTEGIESNAVTLSNYIRYFENSYILAGVERYDIKGKQILEGEKKYYVNDTGFKRFLSSNYDLRKSKILENYVFNAFRNHGYRIYIGRIDTLEIDFIVEKSARRIYVQCAYVLDDDKVIKREYGNLSKIQDSWPKLVVSMDEWQNNPQDGIQHIQAWQLEDWIKQSEKF